MSLDLESLENRIVEIEKRIREFEVPKEMLQELEEMRTEAAEEGGPGNFLSATPEGFRKEDGYFEQLGVHVRGWKKDWHKWNANKKEIFENPTPMDIEKKNLKRGCDLQVQVLEPAEAVGTYTLSLAPTSYYNWRAYVVSLGKLGLEPHRVLTVLSYKMKQYAEGNPVALVQFEYVPFNSPEGQEAIGTPAEWR